MRVMFRLWAALLMVPGVAGAADEPAMPTRPNILWITAEDICPNLGCYGDPDAVTPNLDQFAAEGIRFDNCFSVHPCCSPSRSALATGVYPTRLGTFQHRGSMWVKAELVKCFPTLLRAAGYYTFNGSRGGSVKLDYNFEPRDKPWDAINAREIAWRSRAAGQPFFGQVNLLCTHQSQYGNRPPGGLVPADAKPSLPMADRVHDPARMHVPPYHPDTPAVREIWAEYHDRITQMDGQVGTLLQMLADDGLADDTIVFFFGDNGHGIPGGKGWLWDQGPHVPLIIRFPGRWAHLAPATPGGASARLVSFVDFAPTMLAVAGVEIPDVMQGTAFLGPQAGPPRNVCFAARDFHDNADFDTSRMVRDAQFHYIRNFMPHIGWDPIQYSWQKAPFMLDEWRRAAQGRELQADTRQAAFFRRTKPAEELYDTVSDPWQMNNLAADPQHRGTLRRLRHECDRWMLEIGDLGLLSQYELYVRAEQDSPLQLAADPTRNPVGRLLDAATVANRRDPAALPRLCELMRDDDASLRRWGALGLLALGDRAAPAIETLIAASGDSSPDVRLTAAETLCGLGRAEDAMPVLNELLAFDSLIIRNQALLAICRIGPAATPTLPRLATALGPCRHSGSWDEGKLPELIDLARACVGGEPAARARLSREKYLP